VLYAPALSFGCTHARAFAAIPHAKGKVKTKVKAKPTAFYFSHEDTTYNYSKMKISHPKPSTGIKFGNDAKAKFIFFVKK
jgi:hypothetical protein